MSPLFSKHETALVQSSHIGRNTQIWAFTNILENASIGEECNICDHVFIENQVQIGNRVTIKCGVQIWDGTVIEDDVFIGPNATFTNDKFPRSKVPVSRYPTTTVKKGASIGANATLLPGITIGPFAMVGAGAVVTKDVPAYAIVTGNPARITGYVNCSSGRSHLPIVSLSSPAPSLAVKGIQIIPFLTVTDLRGSLSCGEIGSHLPFLPKRFFVIYDVPGKKVRGEHAHMELREILVCLKGSCRLVVDDGKERAELQLDTPTVGVHIEPLIWTTQYEYSKDAILLVLASEVYQDDDYIRDYHEFLLRTSK